MVQTPENVDKMRVAIVKSPRCSVRRHSTAIGLSDHSVQRILHKDLNFHPYKIALVQDFNDRDMANHRISSEQLLEVLNDDGVISTHLMTDEAHFHLSGYVVKQNYHYWAPENPQGLHQCPLRSERLTFWGGIASFGVLGPHFFENNAGAAVTVTSEHYVAMLCNFCEPEMSSWDRSFISMVSARWSNSPHSKGINECSAGNVSTICHFPWRRCSVAGMFA